MRTRRFGLNGATTGRADLRTDIRVAGEAGYAVLEIRDTKLRDYLSTGGTLYGLRNEMRDAGLEPFTLNAIERATHASGGAELDALLRTCATFCEWAAALACPYVIAVPSPLERIADPSKVVQTAATALRAMAGVGKQYNVRIGFEFLGFRDCSVNTLAAAREVVRAVDDPDVGLVIDAFHFHAGGSTWRTLEELDPNSLFIVHLDDAEDRPRYELTDAHRVLPGDGVIPLKDLVGRIDALGYRGPYSIELFRPEYYSWDPLRLAIVAREKMEALFS